MTRPEFDKLLKELKAEDTLVVAKLDRFARNVSRVSALIIKLIDDWIRVDVCNLGTANTKKEMRDYQITKQNVEFFYADQQSRETEEELKKSDRNKDNFGGNYQNVIWWLPSFFTIPALRKCICTHKVKA